MMKIISRTRFTTILTRLGKNVQSHFMMGMGYREEERTRKRPFYHANKDVGNVSRIMAYY